MRIIDLLNKIANGEEVPKKILHRSLEWVYYGKQYINPNNLIDKYESLLSRYNYSILNDEVEIIEEEQDIQTIEKLAYQQIGSYLLEQGEYFKFVTDINKQFSQMGKKINEIIDVVNKLKNKED